MKYLISTLCFALCAVQLTAQAVRASVRTMVGDGVEEIVVQPLRSDVLSWQKEYGPDLFAYPVEMNVRLTSERVDLSFADADEVMLLIRNDEPLYSSEVTVTTTYGTRSYRLKAGVERMLIDVRGKFALRSDGGSNLRLTRCYVKPRVQTQERFGFGESDDCHPNAPCASNDRWRDQTRSACRIRMALEEGVGWCTGSLINNTALDGTPYILTAEHCLGDFNPMYDLWRFDFNYEGDGCENPSQEPDFQSMTGCEPRSKSRDVDFLLLELNDDIPVTYNVYYSGWDRREGLELVSMALIHHPAGDIKKVSRDVNQASIWPQEIEWDEGYVTPPRTHWRNKFDLGAFEGGSSGGGLYDTAGYLVGQLHGGSGDCFANNAYSGALAAAWDYGTEDERLREWLDPSLEDVEILDGMEHPESGNVYKLKGRILNHNGEGVSGVRIEVDGSFDLLVQADSNGIFQIDQLPRADSIVFAARKEGDPKNGVTAIDLLLIQKHLLGLQPFEHDYQQLAADATNNGEVTAGDILILQKLLLGQIQVLPSHDAWTFLPPQFVVESPEDTLVNLEFQAIKVGDVNATADPKE